MQAVDAVGACGAAVVMPIDQTMEWSWLERPAEVTALAQGGVDPRRGSPEGVAVSILPVPGLSMEVATLAGCFAGRSEDLICSSASRSTPRVKIAE